ncbi:TPA: BrnA antitoxin family protein [Mannheimia haemolytica]
MKRKDEKINDIENPEWTKEDIDNALVFSQMPKELQALVMQSQAKKRGRPVSKNKKVSVTIRYSSNVIEAFKATGKGWQSRINKVLEDYIAQY